MLRIIRFCLLLDVFSLGLKHLNSSQFNASLKLFDDYDVLDAQYENDEENDNMCSTNRHFLTAVVIDGKKMNKNWTNR